MWSCQAGSHSTTSFALVLQPINWIFCQKSTGKWWLFLPSAEQFTYLETWKSNATKINRESFWSPSISWQNQAPQPWLILEAMLSTCWYFARSARCQLLPIIWTRSRQTAIHFICSFIFTISLCRFSWLLPFLSSTTSGTIHWEGHFSDRSIPRLQLPSLSNVELFAFNSLIFSWNI